MSESLRIDIRGPVARVTLNRPEIHNAFDDALVERLHGAAGDLGGHPSVRVVVLAGEGKSFCAGADLNWMKRMVNYSLEENIADSTAMADMFQAWNALPKPVIGRIHGAALGGGTGLAAVCDIPVAADKAVFGFSEVRLGILPAVISPFVTAKIGEANAREFFLSGERFSAERALAMGLVQRVVPAAELDDTVDALIQSLLASGPAAQKLSKALIAQIAGRPPREVRDLTAETIARARASEEGQEGMRAFFDKRRAAWREDD